MSKYETDDFTSPEDIYLEELNKWSDLLPRLTVDQALRLNTFIEEEAFDDAVWYIRWLAKNWKDDIST